MLLLVLMLMIPLFKTQSTASRTVWETVECVSAICYEDPKSHVECRELSPVMARIVINESQLPNNGHRILVTLTNRTCR